MSMAEGSFTPKRVVCQEGGLPMVMERADRARDLSDKRDTRVSSEIIRSSVFGMRYLSDKRDTRVSYITR